MFNRFPKHIKSHSIIVSPGGPSVIIDDHASQGVGEYIVYFDITRLTQADVIHLSVLINPSGNASKAPVLYLESEIPYTSSPKSHLWSLDIPVCQGFTFSLKSIAGREAQMNVHIWRVF